jgi:hypothetical protein
MLIQNFPPPPGKHLKAPRIPTSENEFTPVTDKSWKIPRFRRFRKFPSSTTHHDHLPTLAIRIPGECSSVSDGALPLTHPALLCKQRITYKSTWIDEAHEISPSTQQADAEQTHESVQKRKSATNFCEGICGEAMGNFKAGTTCAAVRGCAITLPACGLPPRGRYLTIRFQKSTAHRGDLLSGVQMKRILATSSCIRQLIRDSGSKQPILDSESTAAAFSFHIPHVFSINYFPGQSGPLKGDTA